MTEETIDTTEDFGFDDITFEDDVDTDLSKQEIEALLKTIEEQVETISQLRDNNREIIKKITTLLNNLKKNPEKAIIKWPNREAAINKFLKEINEIHNGKIEDKPTK